MKKDKIDIQSDKEITKKQKEGLGKKKRRHQEDDLEELMKDDNKKLNKKFEDKMDISECSESEEEIMSESDPDEEVLVDDDHDDKSDEYMDDDIVEEVDTTKKSVKVNLWDEQNNKIKEDQELDFDNEAYEMLHRSRVEWPCMTIDFLIPQNFYPPVKSYYDNSNKNFSDTYPYTTYMVAGGLTNTKNGFLYYMKWYNMHKTKYDDDPDKAADSDEEEGQDPFMKFEKIQVKGNINKIKTMKNSYLTAYWTDTPTVEIVDMRSMISELEETTENKTNKKRKTNQYNINVKSFNRQDEGFAIEWSGLSPGVLAAAGNDRKVEIYLPTDETCSDFVLNSSNMNNHHGVLKGHKSSIEDIIWSPNQSHVLATCSTDKSIRFWDLRMDKNSPPIVIEKAHDSDVNCIAWNHFCDFMIASGGDDAAFKAWDIRYINNGPISNIQWHKGPITALQWDPYEDSQLAVSSEDNRLSIWDFAVEPDDTHLFDSTNQEIPQQLIFLHQGQENIKDLKFHPHYRNLLVSTAENGINVFKPAFDDEDDSVNSDEDDMMDG